MSRRVFEDMDAELLLRLANREDTTAVMRAHFLNDAYLSTAVRFDHAEIELSANVALLAGSDNALLPTTCWWLTMVKDNTAGRPLNLDSKRRIEDGTKTSGAPGRFYTYGPSLFVDRLTDVNRVIKLWFLRKPAELVAGGTSILDEVFDLPIIMLAHIIGLQTLRDLAQASVAEVQLQNYLASKRLSSNEEQKNHTGQGIVVRRG